MRFTHPVTPMKLFQNNEPLNALTHLIATLLSIAGLTVMIIFAALYGSAAHVIGFTIFGASVAVGSGFSIRGVRAALPDHFALGLASNPNQLKWVKRSGIPWDYRYAYLSGGVNTDEGWATWNSPAGEYATKYLTASSKAGSIPVFTYYMLTQSNPHPVDGEPDVNLKNASTMKAYYKDWKLLMQKSGAFEHMVIVHVEPDLWGYMQQHHGANPAKTRVSVSASGFAEAKGYPNNAIGFAQLLVQLRNTYAPNVLLAWHASNWATRTDVVLNEGDPTALGEKVTNFYSALNADFDLIFFDPSDRTAGYYEYVEGDDSRWWDAADFVRFRRYIATITQMTGKPAMLWQVPIGNTLYRSSNNTPYHYQDNRVQYFLRSGNRIHMRYYAKAGVIGILFGAGIADDTSNYDTAEDGITNPQPINGNNRESHYTDDDGGFLRLRAKAYYSRGPLTLP